MMSIPNERPDDPTPAPSALPRRDASKADKAADPGRSGRRFVIVAGLTITLLWGVLYLFFRAWRSRYQERAAFGASQVAPVIDGMARLEPPGVKPGDWEDAVRRTHAMLVTVTDSGLLTIDQMKDLRAELTQTVDRARARPEKAVDELATVWNTISDRAEFVFHDGKAATGRRHIRPALLPPPISNQRAEPTTP